ncbi:MAG TPA: winged helix-turn-helix domain-containing protein [Acetobacteraceae bacterium]|nr:winged helix-turn-helix domain-containing protein [Acetobacteraceae bacterium]
MRILLIEDDTETRDFVSNGLTELGHVVEHADNGRDGLFRAVGDDYDLLIVDRMLPGVDGLTLVNALRTGAVITPVLFLTAMGGVFDRVAGLKAGGDDYLIKPFAFAELAARVEALGRRPMAIPETPVLQVGDLELNRLTRAVRRGGNEIKLQPREYLLLEYLMRHAGQVITRTMLLEGVWDLHFDPHTNVVESHLSRLRSKIDKGFPVELIHTMRGAGYAIRAPG